MLAESGTDQHGRWWFKTDQTLTDITDACEFYVRPKKVGILWWARTEYELWAKWLVAPGRYEYPYIKKGWIPPKYHQKCLGIYDNKNSASISLIQVMEVKGIKADDEEL